MSLNKSLKSDLGYFLSGTFYTALSSITGLLVPILVIPYLIENVGLKYYGLSVVAFTVSYFFMMVVDYGFNITGVNKLSKEKDIKHKAVILNNIIFAKACIFVVLVPLFLLGYFFLIADPLERNVYIISLAIPLASVLNLSWALQGLQKFKTWSLLTILGQFIYVILVYFFINERDDVILINLFYGMGLFITGIASLVYVVINYDLKFHRVGVMTIWDELRSGYHFFISNIGNYMSLYFLSPLVGYLISYEMAGAYSIIEKIYNIARRPFTIYQTFMLPKVSEQVSIKKIIGKITIRKTYIFVILFILVEIVLIFVFKREIISYFTLSNLSLLEKLLSLSLLGLIVVVINCPLNLFLIALDRKKEIMRMAILAPIFGLISGVSLIYALGIIGAIFTLIFVEIFYASYLMFVYLKKPY